MFVKCTSVLVHVFFFLLLLRAKPLNCGPLQLVKRLELELLQLDCVHLFPRNILNKIASAHRFYCLKSSEIADFTALVSKM